MAASSITQSRNCLFTINNPTEEDEPSSWPGVKYLVYQRERGEEGTEHYQGYVMFSSNKRLLSLKTLCPRAHWEFRRGSHQQAVEYCTKESTRIDGPWIIGQPPQQGSRNDLKAVKAKIDAGVPIVSLYEDHFHEMILYKKAFVEYLSDKQKPRSEKTQVSLHWGPPGVGKTTTIRSKIPEDSYWKDSATKWFDGYEFQEHCVFDEFNGGWFPYSTAKRLFDFTPMRVEVKGGSVVFNSKFIHLSTNEDPQGWYPNLPYMELHRRIDVCYKYTAIGVTPQTTWDHLSDPPLGPLS